MNDNQLLRYSRHILLDEIGIEGQESLLAGHALIIGAGGLGSPAALYLASAGMGSITLVDNDTVDLTNLQRQILHTTARVGQPKVESGRQALAQINPEVKVVALSERADEERLAELASQASVVLDCSDNFTTRHAVNRACVQHKVPLVSGAAIRFDGQISVFDSRHGDTPCYACLFPPEQQYEEVLCSTMGVFAPLVGIIGTMQAAEALKLVAGIGESLAGRLLLLDARNMEWTGIRITRNPSCPVCGKSAHAAETTHATHTAHTTPHHS
ncbi:HesA/MoeB/ThiF family protein [Noviherbaspirillum sp. Root189]|uniref:HesA/MoeB/ThiF family protein n=1 Tax=Noviherbaspirillum sp. Root189 TaxID=1736487 RepID=UPI00070B75B5|nr:molybdopterin-synthase adenylyltransferase MoeB [Noviherbaspirillum sp. Root189]KRB87871.1 molybdopterin biosynthesis protein MoeB [Noviherbaspirillum sp. Root189]